MSKEEAIEILSDMRAEYNLFGDEKEATRYHVLSWAIQEMEAIQPSAQPEIICCKDCKNSEHWYRDRRRCFLWSEDGVSVFDDGFCNYAERRGEASV